MVLLHPGNRGEWSNTMEYLLFKQRSYWYYSMEWRKKKQESTDKYSIVVECMLVALANGGTMRKDVTVAA